MRNPKSNYFLFGMMLLFFYNYTLGQRKEHPWPHCEIVSGNPIFLEGKKNFRIIYDYSGMKVEYSKTEQEYLDKKLSRYADNPEKQGKIENRWFSARKKFYEPAFEKYFNKIGSSLGMVGTNNGASNENEVTIKVKTLWIFPGSYEFPFQYVAFVETECAFIDSEGREIVKYVVKYAMSHIWMDLTFSENKRIAQAYRKAAIMVAGDVRKKVIRWKKLKEG